MRRNSMIEEEVELRLIIDRDTHRFLRVAAVVASEGELDMRAVPEREVVKQLHSVVRIARRETWERALRRLQASGFSGMEIIALNGVLEEHKLGTAEAERECEKRWSHALTVDRWKMLVDQLQPHTELYDAFFIVANELVDRDSGCEGACLSMDREAKAKAAATKADAAKRPPALWKRLFVRRAVRSRAEEQRTGER